MDVRSYDEGFARVARELGLLSAEAEERARRTRDETARLGLSLSLRFLLENLRLLTPDQADAIDARLAAAASGTASAAAGAGDAPPGAGPPPLPLPLVRGLVARPDLPPGSDPAWSTVQPDPADLRTTVAAGAPGSSDAAAGADSARSATPAAGAGSPTVLDPAFAPPRLPVARGRGGELPPLAVPERLGEFTILRPLGKGAMGVVFEAEQASLRRRVALKVLHPHVMTEVGIERFRREAVAAARLSHEHIVRVHGAGEASGLFYFAMEFVDGSSLDQLLRGGQVTLERAVKTAIQVAAALQHAHEQGIVHRDIKPSNILVTRDGRALLADFGLVRDVTAAQVTASGVIVGTPAYMSPEQAEGAHERVDARSDVYSLGATLYQMITGSLPFEGETVPEVLNRIFHCEPAPPRRLNPHVPRDLETITQKAMAKEPARRYATARALREDLERHRDGDPILARRPSVSERLVRLARRNRAAAWILAAAAGVTVLFVLVLLVQRGAREREETLARAYRLLNEGKAREALSSFDELLRRSPDDVDARVGRGRAYLDGARVEEAAADFEAALAREPHRLEAIDGRGQARLALGRWEDAERDAAAAVERAPGEPRFRLHRAQALLTGYRREEALAEVDRLHALPPAPTAPAHSTDSAPQRAEALLLRDARHLGALACLGLGRTAEAVERWTPLLEENPRPRECVPAARALATLGRLEDALPLLVRAYEGAEVEGPDRAARFLATWFLGEDEAAKAGRRAWGVLAPDTLPPPDADLRIAWAEAALPRPGASVEGEEAGRALALVEDVLRPLVESPPLNARALTLRAEARLGLAARAAAAAAAGPARGGSGASPAVVPAAAREKVAAALADAEAAAAGDPASAPAWNALGLARLAAGDAGGARDAFDRAVERDAEGAEPRARRAKALSALGDAAGAACDLAGAAARERCRGDAGLLLQVVGARLRDGASHSHSGFVARCLALTARAAALEPTAAGAAIEASAWLALDGRYEEALAELSRCAALDAGDPRLYEERALLRHLVLLPETRGADTADRLVEEIRADVERAAALDPRRPWTLYLRGLLADRLSVAAGAAGDDAGAAGQAEEARAAWRSAVEAEPSFAPGWYRLAVLARRLHRTDEAVEADRRWQAAKTDPERVKRCELLGEEMISSRRFPSAERILQFVVELRPQRGNSWKNYAGACFKRRKWLDSLYCYVQAFRAEAHQLSDCYNAIMTQSARGVPIPLLALEVERRFRSSVDDPAGQCVLALCEGLLGRHAEAADAYERALALDPAFSAVRILQAGLLLDRGQDDAAAAALEALGPFREDVGLYHFFLARLACRRRDFEGALRAVAIAYRNEMDQVEAYLREKDLKPILDRAEFRALFR